MDKATAEKIIELAKAARVERWYIRRPSEEMLRAMPSIQPLLVQRREGTQPYDQDVLAEDYGVTSDELREAHQEFILAAAQSIVELAQHYLNSESEDPATAHGR